MSDPLIVIIVGERQIGKSTVCSQLIHHLRETQIEVSGFITLQPQPHTLAALYLKTGQTYPLTLPFDAEAGIAFQHFRMDATAMEHTARMLPGCFPTTVFILDELGPLELIHGKGWANVLRLLKYERYGVAIIVVRPELLVEAIRQLPHSVYTVIRVAAENRDHLPDSLYRLVHSACHSQKRGTPLLTWGS